MEGWGHDAMVDLALGLRLLVALALSAVLGFERERNRRPAGLRTHMIVGTSAALFVSLGDVLLTHFEASDVEGMRFDPFRIIEATVAGVSFLGAGTIFVSGGKKVRGLTTAATLLAAAGVGMAAGLERYVLAAMSTVIFALVLAVLGRFERHLRRDSVPEPTGSRDREGDEDE